MSLLDRGLRETVTVYPEETVTDPDGNVLTRPSAVGVVTRASVQPVGPPDEDDAVGFATEETYRLRLPRTFAALGAQSEIGWNGDRYAIDGDPLKYNGSRQTQRVEYIIRRS
ncbi:hypothetical protein [Gordonia tangerina]|uniref:Head-to-tail stopper n=1 Tax=Gordonia tangerina TaxID=2911060 RepID=A0ABS9DK68_9ACTN|nr:hypothetical protein [Gordonia tangerina]MCF3938386.1 hypothetical protein [Gordonia tangerina]